MNQLSYNSKASEGGLFAEAAAKDNGLHSKFSGFVGSLFAEASGKVLQSKDINSSVNRFMHDIGLGMLEMQCFSNLTVHALLQSVSGTFVTFVARPHVINTWTSMMMPPASVQFKADSSTLYKPTFSGIAPPQLLTVGYQDVVRNGDVGYVLQHSAYLWEYYASQFTNLGYFIKGVKIGGQPFEPTITYTFFSTYRFGEKTFTEVPLWKVVFYGIVFTEPQLSGLSPSMGAMSRSFSFMYDRYEIILNEFDVLET